MTIWHKRLILFLAKFAGVIIIIFVIALFLYYHFYFKKDNLLKYVPRDAAIYGVFRLNEQIKEKESVKNLLSQFKSDFSLPEFDFGLLNNFVSYNSAIALFPELKNGELAFNYLLIFNLKESSRLPDYYFESLENHNLDYKILKIKALERDILLVSNSAMVLEKALKTASLENPSLADKFETVINLEKLSLEYDGKFYVDLSIFAEFWPTIENEKARLLLFSLIQPAPEPLFLGLKLNQDNLIIESQFKNPPLTEPLITSLPADVLASFNLINGRQRAIELSGQLNQADFLFLKQIKENKEEFEILYGFSFEQDILPLFSEQTQIILMLENKFLIASSFGQIEEPAEKLAQIEQIIKGYLAVKYPIEQKKQLPDYTYINQIVKNPKIPDFTPQKFNDFSFKELSFQDQEFAYFFAEQTLFLSNSSEKIKELIKNENSFSLNYASSCFNEKLANFGQELFIKTEILDNVWVLNGYFKNLAINEDLANNKVIWLCLE